MPLVTVGADGPLMAFTVATRPVAVVTTLRPARGSEVSFLLIEAVVPFGPRMPLQPWVGAAPS